jgi:Domain of unknown function (DUF3597)
MSIFGNILEKLGLRKSPKESQQTRTAQQRTPTQSAPPGSAARQGSSTTRRSSVEEENSTSRRPGATAGSSSGGAKTSSKQPVAMVDVTAHLEQLAAKNSEQLNWRTSIVDLLKLLDMDSSAAARRELADELGAPAGLQDGSAEMNTWLHRTVLRKIADNGGNVPKELLD